MERIDSATQSPADAAPIREASFEAALAACALGEELPARVLIAPWGQVSSSNGDFIVDEGAVAAVMAAFAAHGTDLPIDYEHQSLGGVYASPSGQAPAAGWIRRLVAVRPGGQTQACNVPGLWAEVEWTASGRQRVAAREYRYLSPVVLVRRSDRRVIALHSAALTNKPAIAGMRPIINASHTAGSVAHEPPAARPAAAAPAAPRAHVAASGPVQPAERAGSPADASSETVLAGLRRELGLDPDADAHAVLVAASDRLSSLTHEQAAQEAARRVAAAAQSGKLTEGLRDWAMRLAMSDPSCFDAWVEAAPVVVATGRTQPPDALPGGRDRAALIAAARAAYRREPALASLTSEAAWIAQSLRDAHLDV